MIERERRRRYTLDDMFIEELKVYLSLDNTKMSDDVRYDQLTDYFLNVMKQSIPGIPNAGKNLKKVTDHIKVIVCNLHHAHATLPEMYILFQGAGNAYKKDPAYKGFQFSHENVQRVTCFLRDNEYIDVVPGYPGSEDRPGQLSRMRATQKLIDLIENHFKADPETIYRDSTYLESIIMKGTRPAVKSWKTKPRRKIVKTPENKTVKQLRANLKAINKVIQNSKIELDMDLFEREQLNLRLARDPNKYVGPLDLTRKSLYRVFVDRSLERHGRFYGGFWQGISEAEREKILINGMPIAELDFKSIHPYILYGMEGIEPAYKKDLYYLQSESEEENQRLRPLLKKFLLIMFNSESESGSIQALRKRYMDEKKRAEKRGDPIPEPPPFPIIKANMQPIIEKLKVQHAPIVHHFFTGCGNMLMYHDSQMAEEVMLKFAEKGVACLPVHDSFIVDIQYADICKEWMLSAFKSRFHQEIPIDVIDEVVRVKRIIDGPRVLQMGKEWSKLEGEFIRDINASYAGDTDDNSE